MRLRSASGILSLLVGCGGASTHAVHVPDPPPDDSTAPWVAVHLPQSPRPSFAPVEVPVRAITDDVISVGGVRVRAGAAPSTSADGVDVPLRASAALGRKWIHVDERGGVYLSSTPDAPLETLPIARQGPLRSWLRIDGERVLLVTNGGDAYRIRDDGAERLPFDRPVLGLARDSDGGVVHAAVAPGLVFRIADDGVTAAGRLEGVALSIAREGDRTFEVDDFFPNGRDAIDQETVAPSAPLAEAARWAAYERAGFGRLSGLDRSLFALARTEPALELLGEPMDGEPPSLVVRQDGFLTIRRGAITSFDRAGVVRCALVFDDRARVVLSASSGRFAVRGRLDVARSTCVGGCDSSLARERAVLVDAGVVSGLPRNPIDATSILEHGTADEKEEVLVGDEFRALALDSDAATLVRLTADATVVARTPVDLAGLVSPRDVYDDVAHDGTVTFLVRGRNESRLLRVADDASVRILPSPASVSEFGFADALHGFVVAGTDDPRVFTTNDGGETFEDAGPFAASPDLRPACSPVACLVGDRVFARPDVARTFRSYDLVATIDPAPRIGRAPTVTSPGIDPRLHDAIFAFPHQTAMESLPRIVLPTAFVGRELAPDGDALWSAHGLDRIRVSGSGRSTSITAYRIGLGFASSEITIPASGLPRDFTVDAVRLVGIDATTVHLARPGEGGTGARLDRLTATSGAVSQEAAIPTLAYATLSRRGNSTVSAAIPDAGGPRMYWWTDGDAQPESSVFRYTPLDASRDDHAFYDTPLAEIAVRDDEPGLVVSDPRSRSIAFYGIRGGHRRWTRALGFAGWCETPEPPAGDVVLEGRGEFERAMVGYGASGGRHSRRGIRSTNSTSTWELGEEAACLRRIDWSLRDVGHAESVGTVRLERVFGDDGPRFEARFVSRTDSIALGLEPATATPAPAHAAATDGGTRWAMARRGSIRDGVLELVRFRHVRPLGDTGTIVSSEEPAIDRTRWIDGTELPPQLRTDIEFCGSAGCGVRVALGSAPRGREPMYGQPRAAASALRWDGSASRLLVAVAGFDPEVEMVSVANGRATALPSIPLTACPAELVAVDAATRSVIVSDCPIDRSGRFVRVFSLVGGAWVERADPFPIGDRSPPLVAAFVLARTPYLFVADESGGHAYALIAGRWQEVRFTWEPSAAPQPTSSASVESPDGTTEGDDADE